MINTIREPLLLLDERLHVLEANRSYYQMFEATPDETIGRFLYDLGDRQWDIAALRAALERVVARDEPLEAWDVDHRFAGGRRSLLLNARRLADGEQGRGPILLAMEDVTERRRVERALAVSRLELERSNAALQEFAAVASHDLQEPLRKVLSFGDLLARKAGDALDAEARDYLERMLSATARMRGLINDLLAYSRIATRQGSFAAVDLDQIARDVASDLETRIEQANGTVVLESLPVIEADPLQMRQLFQNLMANALKFRREGVPSRVVVSAAVSGGICRLTFADNGIGFEPKHAERIFGAFQRLHAQSVYQGTGIGLAICRRIAERHGGSISAQGRPGEGAVLTVELPIRPHAAAEDE